MYETGADGKTRATGLRLGKAGEEKVVQADVYVAALDVPGAKRLIPQASAAFPSCPALPPTLHCRLGCCSWGRPARSFALTEGKRSGDKTGRPGVLRLPVVPLPAALRTRLRLHLRCCTERSVIACKYRTSKPEPVWDDNQTG